ncbi:hypothetical protein DSO57_1019471 [Entomophthora muscae]|uniref:Uncharacterized protein n=1 Tax=Entomophthora muscae TaxID=34485 RepID=A0ACC2SGN4_9FUNG|nr:hypothetical protein DSO57_1019471 [Entomophthora muscae]
MLRYLCVGYLAPAASAKVNILPFGPSLQNIFTLNEADPNLSLFTSQSLGDFSPKTLVQEFMRSRGFSRDDYVITSSHVSKHTQVSHFYLRQLVKGKQVFNGDININISPEGKVISAGDSFYRPLSPLSTSFNLRQTAFSFGSAQPANEIGPVEAMHSLLKFLGLEQKAPITVVSHSSLEGETITILQNVTSTLQNARAMAGWIQLEDGTLEPVWDIQLDLKDDWFNAHVSAKDKRVASLVNWVSSAEYTVFPLGTNDPNDGKRVKLYDPADKVASPLGWHDRGKGIKFTDTEGNNVIAGHIDDDDDDDDDDYSIPSHPGVEGGINLIFDFFTQPQARSRFISKCIRHEFVLLE